MALLVIGIVGALAGGGLFAYFNDTETSANNTFNSATLHIVLDGDLITNPDNFGRVHNGVVPPSHKFEFKPCESGWLNFDVTNTGNIPCHLYKKISLTTDPLKEADSVTIAAVTAFDLSISYNGDDPTPAWTTVYTYTFDYLPGPNPNHMMLGGFKPIVDHYIDLGLMGASGQPHDKIWVRQSFHMDGNLAVDKGDDSRQHDLMGKIMTFDELYVAQQLEMPAPSPIVLP